jgi:hypothetical protein
MEGSEGYERVNKERIGTSCGMLDTTTLEYPSYLAFLLDYIDYLDAL